MSDAEAQQSTRELFVSTPEDRINIRIGSGTYGMVISGSNTQERLAFIGMWIPSGDGPMPHTHECEETFYVVEGEVTIFLPRDPRACKGGDGCCDPKLGTACFLQS